MSGPIAPERNPPIHPEYYQPRVYNISALTLGSTTTVTTSVDHDYVVGQLIRLLIPVTYGAYQISGQQGYVKSIPADNQVEVTINSQVCNAFVPSPTYGPTLPQIIAIGDCNQGYINPTGRSSSTTTIPGAFINISPL